MRSLFNWGLGIYSKPRSFFIPKRRWNIKPDEKIAYRVCTSFDTDLFDTDLWQGERD